MFAGTNVSIDGKHHLGAALGSHSFVGDYITAKVQSWSEELSSLSAIAVTHPHAPHAAYAVFTHGLQGYWNYVYRTVPDISNLLQPLEDAICQRFYQL